MINWAVPWGTDEIIDFVFLAVTCVIVTAVPVVYGFRANLRDPLARAVVIGTGTTAFAFTVSVVVTLLIHTGWQPPGKSLHWIARGIYAAVALGKLTLLLALLSAIRGRHSRYRDLRERDEVA